MATGASSGAVGVVPLVGAVVDVEFWAVGVALVVGFVESVGRIGVVGRVVGANRLCSNVGARL